jgi:hypothetical protein
MLSGSASVCLADALREPGGMAWCMPTAAAAGPGVLQGASDNAGGWAVAMRALGVAARAQNGGQRA